MTATVSTSAAATRKPMAGQPVYVVDGSRTPFLKARTGPGAFRASDLAVAALRPLLGRQPFAAEEIDEVVLGCIMPNQDETNIGRVVALRAGCSEKTPAWTVQRNCASGMQAIDNATHSIAYGRADLVLAGGSEAMSHAPILWGNAMVAWLGQWMAARGVAARGKALLALRPAYLKPIIAILRGLTDPVVGLSMGQTAEVIAHRFLITREMMDNYAVRSHLRLAAAQAEGRLTEIEAIFDSRGNHFDFDDGVRPDSSNEKLAKLRPVFDREFGAVTAGNSAQITDGSAWLLLASEVAVKRHDLPVLGRIVDSQWAGLDPRQMGLGPVHAVEPLLKRRRLSLAKIDYWEINEAFAAQVLACLAAFKDASYCKQEFGRAKAMGEIDQETLNIDGGAVALGHPVGTSGARIVLHLLKTLEHKQAKRGIASICIGGGQGGAMLVERV